MIKLPRNTILGELSLFETYKFYDIPRLFSCNNRSGTTFLVLSTFDDGEEFEWLYLPISSDRLASLLDKKIDLRTCFVSPEDAYLLKVVSDFEGKAKTNYVFPEEIDDEDLPELNVFLEYNAKHHHIPGAIDAKEAAIRSMRETYNFHLYPSDTQLPELDLDQLGSIITSFQELAHAIGQYCEGTPTLKGPIPTSIIDQTKFRATQIFSGSFGLQIKAKSNADLFGNSLSSDVLLELTNLLSILDNEDALSNKLHQLHGRVASKYRTFIKELKRTQSPLRVDWGSPNSDRGTSLYIEQRVIESIHTIVSKIDIDMSESVTFRAELLGLDVETRRYRVRHLEDNEIYSGNIANEAFGQVQHSEINAHYFITVKQIIETNSLSGTENIKWLMTGIKPAT